MRYKGCNKMEDTTKTIESNPKNMYVPICITQAICMVVIFIAVLIIKFFFTSSYEKCQKWYSKHILDETTITAFFEEEDK